MRTFKSYCNDFLCLESQKKTTRSTINTQQTGSALDQTLEKGRFMNLMLLQQKPPVLYNVVCPKCPELANPFRWKGD